MKDQKIVLAGPLRRSSSEASRQGFTNIAIMIGIIVLLGGVAGYFALVRKSAPAVPGLTENTTSTAVAETPSEAEVLANLKTDWQIIQALISFRPTYHNQEENAKAIWRAPNSVQFIGKSNILVEFEDDNNPHVGVFNYNGDRFNLLEVSRNYSFGPSEWQRLASKYGTPSYPVATYSNGVIRNKEIVTFPDLTKITENVFLGWPYSLGDETAGWKTYRNEQYGFEFKYPSQINGKPAILVERKEYDDFLLFQSKISYGVPVEGKGGVMEQPYFENLVSFSARANSALSVDVDLGGQGGYTYDPVKDTWYSRDNPQQKLTWSEMYNYFSSSLPEGLPMVKTISGQNAFPYDGGAYESYWDGYRIFNTERRLFLHFYHFHGYVPESITTEVVKENKAIRKFLQGVTETVKFF